MEVGIGNPVKSFSDGPSKTILQMKGLLLSSDPPLSWRDNHRTDIDGSRRVETYDYRKVLKKEKYMCGKLF